jgi:hypothetical protein
MLPLLFAMIVFLFLLVGAVAFLICVLVPPLRRYALSVALWCAVWGPAAVALMTLAGLALVADAFITRNGDLQSFHSPRLLSVFGWGYLVAGALAAATAATAVAWVHQFVVRRFTFALFRLYATAVVAGIGSVLGWSLSWWLLSRDVAYTWAWSLFTMPVLVGCFGLAAYKGARGLRGEAASSFSWVTPEEFIGS